jgi:hypothetical protein
LNIDDVNDNSHQESDSTNAFNNFLEKRTSTIPDEPISEQHIHIDLQQQQQHQQSNNNV